MVNKRRFTWFFILLSLLLVLAACNNEQKPPVEKEHTCSYVQDGDTFTFTDESPRYMIRYNSSSDKEISIADTGFIKSYSSSDTGITAGYQDSVLRIPRSMTEGSFTEENEGVKVKLTDYGYKVGDRRQFSVWDGGEDGKEIYREANMTLRVEGEHCLIWCEDGEDGLDVSDELLKTLQENFDRVYPLETALFGTCSDYTVKDKDTFITEANEKIYINIVSMGEASKNIGGFFSPVDMYKKDYIKKYNEESGFNYQTNEARMFYVNYSGEPSFIKDMDGCVSVLIHEFQHMLRFICDNIVKGIETDVWYNEMMSLLAEDIFSVYLDLDIKSTAISRLFFFKLITNWGVTCWDNDPNSLFFQASYSVSYAFGSYLLRNYGGADLLAALTDFKTAGTGKDVINNAFRKLDLKNKEGNPLTFEDAAADFHKICIYTSKADAAKGHISLNREVKFNVGDNTITAPAIDLLEGQTVMPFPYSEKITDKQYRERKLYPYGFILSDLTNEDEKSGEEPIKDAKKIVMELPEDPAVQIYFY